MTKIIFIFVVISWLKFVILLPCPRNLEAKCALVLNRDMYLAYLCRAVLLCFQEYTNVMTVHLKIFFC